VTGSSVRRFLANDHGERRDRASGDVRKFVEEVGAECALDLERVFDLKVAVSEACANVVEHAGCQTVPWK